MHSSHSYAISKVGTDLIGRFYAEAYKMTIMTTRMFTHTGPRRGDVFASHLSLSKLLLLKMIYQPVIKVGNLKSLRTIADVRDAVRAYFMLVTVDPVQENIIILVVISPQRLDIKVLINLSSLKNELKLLLIKIDQAIDADLQIPDTKIPKSYRMGTNYMF